MSQKDHKKIIFFKCCSYTILSSPQVLLKIFFSSWLQACESALGGSSSFPFATETAVLFPACFARKTPEEELAKSSWTLQPGRTERYIQFSYLIHFGKPISLTIKRHSLPILDKAHPLISPNRGLWLYPPRRNKSPKVHQQCAWITSIAGHVDTRKSWIAKSVSSQTNLVCRVSIL